MFTHIIRTLLTLSQHELRDRPADTLFDQYGWVSSASCMIVIPRLTLIPLGLLTG